MALALYASLGIELTPAERERVNDRRTEHLQAVLAYGAGLEAGDAGDFGLAARSFEAAAALDPGFTEAAERAEEARSLAAAEATSTRRLATLDGEDLMTELGPEDWRRLQVGLRELVSYIPSPGGRDVVPEATGTEGLAGSRRGGVEFIFRGP